MTKMVSSSKHVVVPQSPTETVGPKAIAFVTEDTRQQDRLCRVLRRAVGQVEPVQTLRGMDDLSCFAVIAVHYDALSEAGQAAVANDLSTASEPPPLLLLSEKRAEEDFAMLFGSHTLTNMLAVNDSGVDVSDLSVTIQKIRRREIFGLDKYFPWGLDPRCLRITSSLEKNAALDTIDDYAVAIGIPLRLRASIRTVADEFLTNAVYNAPVRPDGTQRFPKCPRTETVRLDVGEHIEVQYCCDSRRFGISVADPFGSLDPRQVQDYLARGFLGGDGQMSDQPGGAGLGFFQILDSVSHLVVNIDKGKKTEMVGLIDVSGGYRNFASAGKSFNIFVQERAR